MSQHPVTTNVGNPAPAIPNPGVNLSLPCPYVDCVTSSKDLTSLARHITSCRFRKEETRSNNAPLLPLKANKGFHRCDRCDLPLHPDIEASRATKGKHVTRCRGRLNDEGTTVLEEGTRLLARAVGTTNTLIPSPTTNNTTENPDDEDDGLGTTDDDQEVTGNSKKRARRDPLVAPAAAATASNRAAKTPNTTSPARRNTAARTAVSPTRSAPGSAVVNHANTLQNRARNRSLSRANRDPQGTDSALLSTWSQILQPVGVDFLPQEVRTLSALAPHFISLLKSFAVHKNVDDKRAMGKIAKLIFALPRLTFRKPKSYTPSRVAAANVPLSTTQLPRAPLSETEQLLSNINRACNLLKRGAVGKARSALFSTGSLSVVDQNVVDQLTGLYPNKYPIADGEPTLPTTGSLAETLDSAPVASGLTVFDVKGYVDSRKPGTAGGLDGWTYDDIKQLARSQADFYDHFTPFIDVIATVAFDPEDVELKSLIFNLRGIALDKGEGKVRPVGISSVFRTIAAGALCHRSKVTAVDLIGSYNVAYGVPGGLEAIIQALRIWNHFEGRQQCVVISLDVKNAFNSIKRSKVYAATKRIPGFERMAEWMHSTPMQVIYEDRLRGVSHSITMHEGTIQGAPESSIAYAMAQRPVFDNMRSVFPQVAFLSNHDDSYIVGPVTEAFNAFAALKTQMAEELGLELVPHKCKAYLPRHETVLDSNTSQHMKETHTAAIEEAQAAAQAHNIAFTTDGFTVGSSPIGSESYMRTVVEQAAQKALDTLSAVQGLKNLAPARMKHSLHNIFAMLRLCVPAQFAYWLRTTPPSITMNSAIKLDGELYKTCMAFLNVPPGPHADYTNGLNRFYIPTRNGGLGFTSSKDNATPAYLASICSTGRLIAFFSRNETQDEDNNGAAIAAAFKRALFDLPATFPHYVKYMHNKLTVVSAHLFAVNPIPGEQSNFARKHVEARLADEAEFNKQTNRFSSRELLTMRGVQGAYGYQWMAPTSFSLRDDDFYNITRFLLGFPMHMHTGNPGGANAHYECNCGATVTGKEAYMHGFVCNKLAGAMKHRHDAVRKAMQDTFIELQNYVKEVDPQSCRTFNMVHEPLLKEKRIWAAQHSETADTKGDLYVWPANAGMKPAHLLMDIVVTAPSDADKVLGDAAGRGVLAKYRKYVADWKLLPQDPAFLAVSLEPTGYMQKVTEIRLKNFMREALGVPLPGSPEAEEDGVPTSPPIYSYFLEKLRRSVSLALMRGTAYMLTYARMGLRKVNVGRMGNIVA
jgi:hypothetical protein